MNLAALALLSATLGVGQPNPGLDYQVTKNRKLQIGIDFKPERKKDIRYVVLYASRDQGSTWDLVAQQPPSATAFTFTAPNDGVYWLNMVVTYLDGKSDPPDITLVPPAQKLIIDTVKPVVKIASSQKIGDEVSVEWTVEDKNANDASTRVFYRSPSGDPSAWETVPPENMTKRSARFTPTVLGPMLVQVVTADLAGNIGSATREVVAASATSGTPIGVGAPPVQPKPAGSETAPLAPATLTSGVGEPMSLNPMTPPAVSPGGPVAPAMPTMTREQPMAMVPIQPSQPLANSQQPAMTPAPTMPIVVDPPQRPIAVSGGTGTGLVPATTVPQAAPEVTPLQYSKSPRFDLGYQLEAGPSGVTRVDLYVTRDDGKSWTRWSTHDGRESPLKVVLDTRFNTELEGEYGFKLVPVSGAGLSEGAPLAGTSPEARVLVDTAPPVIKVYQPTADPTQKNTLVLHWEATDKNLGKDPIAIEYSESVNGPWKPVTNHESVVQVAVGAPNRVANTGQYAWQLPATLATPKVFLRFTAWDLAGNKSEVTTPNAVLVDLTKPKARVQGITASPQR
jgi:hypothetical protein